jgi:hypothetical protein
MPRKQLTIMGSWTFSTAILAASFPAIGPHGSSLVADLSQAGSEPLLTHPRA